MPSESHNVSNGVCPECRGEAYFVLFPRQTRVKSLIACPACGGSGQRAMVLQEAARSSHTRHAMEQPWDVSSASRRVPSHVESIQWNVES